MILAGDVGATKILLEVGEARSGKWFPKLARRYATAEAASFPEVLTAFLGEWNVVREKGQRIEAAGFGVAGPQLGNRIKMTHRPLTVDGNPTHVIGVPLHWGFTGQARKGYGANTLTPSVGDANTQTPEFKAFLVNVEKTGAPAPERAANV